MEDRSKLKTALVLGRAVRYTVRRSRRARRMSLHVSSRTGLEVILPERWPLRDVDRAIEMNARWISHKVDTLDVRDGPRSREITTGSLVPVFGRPRRVEISPLTGKRARIRLVDDTFEVELGLEDRLDPKPMLRAWLRRQAGLHLRERVAILARDHDFTPGRISVGERTTRWGSCSSRGNLSFCYRLVMAPVEVIDAVICHELCHLQHMNHGVRFKALLAVVCPEHDRWMGWLREHAGDVEI